METKGTSTAIMVRDPEISIYDRMADPLEAVEKLGGWIAKSRLLGVETPEQGIVVALTCMQERITPLEFRRRYHIIKGTPSMRADYMQSAFQAAGGRVRWGRTDDQVCTVTIFHPDHAPNGFTNTVELDVLRARKLTTATYQSYPRQMLRARAVSEAIRAVMPSINAGEYTPEEEDRHEPAAAPRWGTAQEPAGDAEQVSEVAETTPAANAPEKSAQAPQKTSAPKPEDRAAKVISHFRGKGISQVELEWFAGGGKEQIFAAAWGEPEFRAFTAAKEKIEAADLEQRARVIERLFRMSPEDGEPVDPADADPGEPPAEEEPEGGR